MRIVGGAFRGRSLLTPSTDRIRPTTDRTRESLFNIIEHGIGHDLVGARVLDLFSGTGALGLEAMSRGAKFCLFVEEGAEGRGLVRGNVEAFGLTGATRIFRRDATRLGPAGGQGTFDLLFADPPYGKGLGEAALASALEGGWLAPEALCVLEEAGSAPFALPEGFVLEDTRAMGDTVLRFLRAAATLTKT
ncbi:MULTISPECIES: 16S rRNA (guanine(966)-N(2))-methyltransferase RsmD [unclassified Aureimonas]|uniref:16S rRNA (guanine(966)-N(2))-methyltransferase RsmD n=1 Tax=unclassified Aureimonas TaxID=2615206 RepID=UPI0006FCD319|nr:MULTISPECIES: 16S rRNA (guanine(966)-N(2))-methyltransferase RsmD [unclassified Aureimonas]KQT69736.1 16S rRNA (guanine(966)-N(2))-methyltransferase RsmD [Aureimonas sp. Leaf427]KQT76112.1 16S rRNA (guanine(966)-N(2))-methyltransferase RsmD [Aureimonas sp. Leaf460]